MTFVWSYSPTQAQIDDDLNFIERFKAKRAARKAKGKQKLTTRNGREIKKQQQRSLQQKMKTPSK